MLHFSGQYIHYFLKLFCIQLSIPVLAEHKLLCYCHIKFVSIQDSLDLDIDLVSFSDLFHLVLQHLHFIPTVLHDAQIC